MIYPESYKGAHTSPNVSNRCAAKTFARKVPSSQQPHIAPIGNPHQILIGHISSSALSTTATQLLSGGTNEIGKQGDQTSCALLQAYPHAQSIKLATVQPIGIAGNNCTL